MSTEYQELQLNSASDLLQAAWLPNWQFLSPRSAGPAVRFLATAWMPNFQALVPGFLRPEEVSKMKPALQLVASAWAPNFAALSPARSFEITPVQRLFLSAWLPENEALLTAFGLLLAAISACKMGAETRQEEEVTLASSTCSAFSVMESEVATAVHNWRAVLLAATHACISRDLLK